jgi:hypothetical protein
LFSLFAWFAYFAVQKPPVCRAFVPPPTAACHRYDVIIHGPILAWGVGHLLSNLKLNPKSEGRNPKQQKL